MAQNKQTASVDIIAEFRQAMADVGLVTTDPIYADGELNRVSIQGDPSNTRNGWYVLFADGLPAGEFGCWKRGIQSTWCAKGDSQRTPDETKAMMQRIETARREREERQRMRQQAVAVHAQTIWDQSAPVDGRAHPYLERKQVSSHGLRRGEWPSGVSALLVPVMDAGGKIVSLQAIFANADPAIGRDKDFLAGGKKRGCFYPIGTPPESGAGVIVICEGYATGASIYESTGYHTIVAFDAHNLRPVAEELRRRWPACQLVIAADNDRWTQPTDENPHIMSNPGVTLANKIAGVLVAVPEFADLSTKPTDFNDLAVLEGADAVASQINAVLPVEAEQQADQSLPLSANVNPFGFPHMSDKGQPLNTPENLAYLLNEYGISCRYNLIKKDVQIDIPGRDFSQDNRAVGNLATINGLCARARMPRENIGEYLQLIADCYPYNPVAEWIDSKPWDGVDRLDELTATLDPVNYALARVLLRRWMIGAVAAAYSNDGVNLQGVLVIQGQQDSGKTTWLMSLAGNNRDLALEGATLNPSDRDSVKHVISYWLVELGELDATFRKSDIAALKSFITRPHDEIFLRYSRAISNFPRRTAFMASVNPKTYLRDETGNRRYWTIECGAGMNAMHKVDMQQVWAQVKTLYESGEQYRLSRDEMNMLNTQNVEHEEVSPVEELVLSRFDWKNEITRPMTATEILIAIGYDRPTKAQKNEAGIVLRKLLGCEPRKSGGRRVFDMPASMAIRSAGGGDDSYPF